MDTDRKRLAAVLNIRVSKAERVVIAEQAALAGLTVSAYCRRLILGRVVAARVDTTVVGELRRLGGLAKAMHTASGGAHSEETAAAWRAVTAAINRIAGGSSASPRHRASLATGANFAPDGDGTLMRKQSTP